MRFIKHLILIMMEKLVSRIENEFGRFAFRSVLFSKDFREFVIGFLLTTKGTMEEKLDYTFQLYGLSFVDRFHSKRLFVCFSDIDKDGYIDQSEIDVMAKVNLFSNIFFLNLYFYFLRSTCSTF